MDLDTTIMAMRKHCTCNYSGKCWICRELVKNELKEEKMKGDIKMANDKEKVTATVRLAAEAATAATSAARLAAEAAAEVTAAARLVADAFDVGADAVDAAADARLTASAAAAAAAAARSAAEAAAELDN